MKRREFIAEAGWCVSVAQCAYRRLPHGDLRSSRTAKLSETPIGCGQSTDIEFENTVVVRNGKSLLGCL
jgi:hypothetical protein